MAVKAKTFLLRFDADQKIGIGHFSRCFALGRELRAQGYGVVFVVKNVEKIVENILEASRMIYFKIPRRVSWGEEAQYLFLKYSVSGYIVILDIATLYAFNDIQGVSYYLKELVKKYKVVMLDGMGSNAISMKIATRVDMVVMPYFGAKRLPRENRLAKKYLLGPQYYIFPAEYKLGVALNRKIRLKAEKVLITMGGADPLGVTLKIIRALHEIKDLKLKVRVIIGPNFSRKLKKEIYKRVKFLEHDFEIINSPLTLFRHMLWCDVALTSSGLTKYELAITGTPSLQVSFNKDYEQVNLPFLRMGAARHLGVYNAFSCELLASELTLLLADARCRLRMFQKGRIMMDGRGTSRVIGAISNLA